MQTIQEEVGLHESLASLHQVREVTLVALFVDSDNSCLLVDGELPHEKHVCLGAHKCALPFTERVVRTFPGLRCKPRGTALTYDHQPDESVRPTTFVVVRIDVVARTVVPRGEWVASAERAQQLSEGDLVTLRCIQLHLGQLLAWKLKETAPLS